MGDLTKNFNKSEFACKCGCGKDNINVDIANIAQAVRDYLGVAVRVNSGVRCEKHNKAAGGAANSYHVQGLAADLSCKLGAQTIFLATANLYAKGKIPKLQYCQWYKKKDFVHLDVGKRRNNIFAIVA